jgi:hypothetical protein
MKFTPIIILSILTSCSSSVTKELKNNVHLKKDDNDNIDLIFDMDTDEEWIFKSVDSLSISENHYGFLFYGVMNKGKAKKWFYVTGAPLEFKKGFGDWYDSEFRKYRLKELDHGEQLYEGLKPTEQIWNELN